MIKSIVRSSAVLTGKEEVLVLPVFDGERKLTGVAKKLDVLCRSSISKSIGHFDARPGATLMIAFHQSKTPQNVLLLGMGRRGDLDAERAANAGGSASRALKGRKFRTCHLLLTDAFEGDYLDSFLKGVLLAQYSFAVKGGAGGGGETLRKVVVLSENRGAAAAIARARAVAEHTAIARDLVNEPANRMTPAILAERATALARQYGVACRVMTKKEIEKMGFAAVLSVAKGSREEPRFIVMHHNKGAAKRDGVPLVCLVGKGVTFDSGGISIKPWLNMHEMKGDMAGGALVIGAITAAARMKMPVEVVGLIPCVENMPSGTAFRPGDIIDTYAGKTIEILSTDAEGRLILSDALAYAREYDPDVIVDFATLTGAVVIALGTRIAGVMGNDQDYIDWLEEAGCEAGELVWQLPLDETFSELVKGDISDYKNYSGRDASSITAAALLGEFAGDTPWVHVDIAGTFWSEGNRTSYNAKGATGYGVDLALRFLEKVAAGLE